MDYQVLSRRYRPRSLDEVVGQQSIVKILGNVLRSGRIPHAFLFTGIRGTGKTTSARILARSLNCTGRDTSPEPCGSCASCTQIADGRAMDVIEVDAASNTSVDHAREIIETTRMPPMQLRYKVYIIDEVHMLSTAAFNALLKTLEEPPPYVVFVLATTDVHKVPDTVLSRCVRLNFKRVDASDIAACLKRVLADEQRGHAALRFDETALFMIARQAEGSVRDAMTLLELVLAYGDGVVSEEHVVEALGLLAKDRIFDAIAAIGRRDAAAVLDVVGLVAREGGSFQTFLDHLVFYLRHLLLASQGVAPDPREFSTDEAAALENLGSLFDPAGLIVAYQSVRQLMEQVRQAANPQFDTEAGLLKIVVLKEYLDGGLPGGRSSAPHVQSGGAARRLQDSPPSAARVPAKPAMETAPASRPREKAPDPPAACVSDGSDELLVRSIVDRVSARNPMLAAVIAKAGITLAEGRLNVCFEGDDKFHHDHLSGDEGQQDELRRVARDVLGREVALRVVIDRSRSCERGPVENGGLREKVLAHPKLRLIMDEFQGAKVVDIRKVSRQVVDEDGPEDASIKEESDE